MHSLKADEATICCEEKVGIGTRQMRERIEGDTIYGYENRGRKARLEKELNPMNVVVIGHVLLSSTLRRLTPLYLGDSDGSIARGILASNKTIGRIARTWDQ
jgi:hypothetical protein